MAPISRQRPVFPRDFKWRLRHNTGNFEPKPDISAYELALIIREYGSMLGSQSIKFLDGGGPYDRLPMECARHFVREPAEGS